MSTPHLQRYRNGEYIQYMTDVLTLLSEKEVAALQLGELTGALAASLRPIEAAFKQPRDSELTPEIVALDARRGHALIGLRGVTKYFTYHSNPAIAAAATALHAAIAAGGDDISRLPYQQETAVINRIVRDWEKEELAAAVHTLHLASWLAELKQSNTQFSARYLERITETAQRPLSTMGELRKEATQAYRNLVRHISAHATLNSSPLYSYILKELEVLAKRYNQGVTNRSRDKTA